MTKKEKEEQLDNLSDCVQIEATIECEECRDSECDYDEVETAQKAFADGWRYVNGRALCRKCVRKLNAKNKKLK